MKKVVATIMAASMALSITACGGSAKPAETKAPAAPAAKETTKAAETKAEAAAITEGWADGSTVYFDVPAKAGGGSDLFTRYLTQSLTELYPKVNFVVTNYDTGEVGMQHCVKSEPDGKTLVAAHGGGIIQYMCGSSDTNLKEDLQVVGIMNQGGPQAMIAYPGAPYTNFKELGDYIKEHQGEVTVGCTLGGTSQIIFVKLLDALTDGHPEWVNYVQCSSEADKLTNVASHAIDVANCSIPNALAYDADGKLTILGTLGPKSSTTESMNELLGTTLDPKFASTVEQGADVTWDTNYYMLVAKDTPEDVCRAVNAALMKAAQTQSYIDGNKKMATFVAPIDFDGSVKALDDEWAAMDELLGNMGLKVR